MPLISGGGLAIAPSIVEVIRMARLETIIYTPITVDSRFWGDVSVIIDIEGAAVPSQNSYSIAWKDKAIPKLLKKKNIKNQQSAPKNA